jgi:integrase
MSGRLVRALRTKAERKTERQQRGPLRSLRVTDKTLRRYENSCERFFQYRRAHNKAIELNEFELDLALCEYVEYLWEEGDPRNYATDCLSGFQHFIPALRRRLPAAWQLLTAWSKHELPCRATPMPQAVVLALAGALEARNEWGMGLAILVGYHCLLRTGEIVNIRCKDFAFGAGTTILQLPSTKSGVRFGHLESVVIDDRRLQQMLKAFVRRHLPGDPLCPPSCAFRRQFALAVEDLHLPDLVWKPYSLRRGGATAHFREFGSMDATMARGRWANARTCRIYVNDSMQALAEVSLSPRTMATLTKFQRRLAALPE